MLLPLGTLVNVAAVLIGGTLGLFFRSRMPERIRNIVFQGLGLCTLVIGMGMALKVGNPLILIFSIVIGGVTGELIRLDVAFDNFGNYVKKRVGSDNAMFTDGMITAFLIFCVGSMTILGAFDEGLRGDPTLLYTKSMLDGFASIALASTYGAGVLFCVIPLFIYQYGLTLCAAALQGVVTDAMMAQVTATGGVLILGIGISLLEIRRINVSNLLPSLLIVVLLTAFFA